MTSASRERACHLRALSLVLAASSSGCAIAPRLVPEADSAAAAVDGAVEVGGREDPGAVYYLALAERELGRTRVLLRVGDLQGARSWARRALADAEVARLLAVEVSVRAAARRTEADVEALSRELDGAPAARGSASR
jgi:hypothetical protein